MTISGINNNCCSNQNNCPTTDGCPPGVCPDFEIKQHDTKPPYRISVSDCNGPLDLENTVAEVSMWAKAKLKKAITDEDTYFALADNIGFEQANIGDIIVVDRARNPEQMLITGFDESLKYVQVTRGYNSTTPGSYKKGQKIRIFRILNATAETETVLEDIAQVDGTIETDVVTDSLIVYNWSASDTCLPGCYFLEIKLLKMAASMNFAEIPFKTGISCISDLTDSTSVIPTFDTTSADCSIGAGVEWVRRFPNSGEGFLIKIWASPTSESLV